MQAVYIKEVKASSPKVSYQTHVQEYGWQNWKNDGQMSGTSGESKRLEGIKIQLSSQEYSGNIEYRTHVEEYGWQDFVKNGEMAGTTGESKRLEAIQIRLTGEMAEHYDIYYRVHAQNFGWLGWTKNGKSAGTAGFSYRLEGIQIQLVSKYGQAPGSTNDSFKQPMVQYSTHVQEYGWQSAMADGQMSGTSGESKRLEGIQIWLPEQRYSGNIEYSTHVEEYGWQEFVKNGEMAGTSGESKRLEAIRIRLTGEISNYYDVYYQVHVENLGWQDWVKNGEDAGTVGYSYRLEGIKIQLIKKDGISWVSELETSESSSQMLIVSVYDKTYADVSMYTKRDGLWQNDFSVTGRIGSAGVGKVKEGDKKTPTGVFSLHTPFGIKDNPGCPLEYIKVTKNHYWSGMPEKYYNKLVDASKVSDYNPAGGEHLIDYEGVYNYCVAIDYNPEGIVGKGSAIFLHCQGRGTTAGCVSIPESYMIYVLQNLRSDAKIIIDHQNNIMMY